MLLTCLAMRTTRLRLGSAAMVLPRHNPVLLAEEAATLDLIAGARLDLGIGKGYRHSEFTGFQISPEEAQARFDEAVEVITRSRLARSRFSHHGRFWRFEDIVVEPPPAQQPHPPFSCSPSQVHPAHGERVPLACTRGRFACTRLRGKERPLRETAKAAPAKSRTLSTRPYSIRSSSG
jgi:alkanesulfonate monooxygenase SsuD/methylene tetrahydromethanopterin reductase-like flavin-dependent oxidoreductase (luciferase family)